MFAPGDVTFVEALLATGVDVLATGIDLDHRAQLFPTVKALLELGPDEVVHRRAVCDVCRRWSAVATQVLTGGEPYLEDLGGQALPADGTFTYEPRCRTCLVRP
jgi:thymidine kinase